MSDTEERIAKLQKLLDRVLSRDDELEDEPVGLPEQKPEEEIPTKVAKNEELDKVEDDAAQAAPEPPLESRSRLVAATPAPDSSDELSGVEELSEDDLIPDSKSPSEIEDAVPLVRRSRGPAEAAALRREKPEREEVTDGRIVLGLEDVQVEGDAALTDEERLAAEIAAEEVESGEIAEDAPSSSRRPIALSDEERHSSPPESGKHATVAPASADDVTAGRTSSAPPAAGPDVIKPEMPAVSSVAAFAGELPAPRPRSFGELLDEALRL
jgi:hypothetical protein